MKSSYYQKLLRHPEWIKRRKEIIQARGGHCELCGNIHDLQVHHKKYQRGKMPWEYPDHNFKCYCEDCHRRVTYRYRRRFNRLKKYRRPSARRRRKI